MDYFKKETFEFAVEAYRESSIQGKFINFQLNKKRLKMVDAIIEKEHEFWYLDDNGCRLEDKELFEKSPWSIVENNTETKIVQRFMDYKNGTAFFSLLSD